MDADVYILYADELFFINFCSDMICIFISLRLCGIRAKTLRLCLASALGGIYSVFSAVTDAGMFGILMHVAALGIICLTAAGWVGVRKLALLCTCFFLTCAMLGGCIQAAFSLLGAETSGITPLSLLLSLVISAFAAVAYFLKARMTKRSASATFVTEKGEVTATLLIDSGNLAVDPMRGLPVIIVSRGLFGEGTAEKYIEIPIDTASGSDVLPGFFPKEIRIGKRVIHACVAIGRAETYGGFDGILPDRSL